MISATALPGSERSTLIKCGRTTGWTEGLINSIDQYHFDDCANPNLDGSYPRAVSQNPLVLSRSRSPFAEKGDSGAFVLNELGKLVGIVIGGSTTGDHSFMTLIDDIFEDIIHLTGAKAVRLPLPNGG